MDPVLRISGRGVLAISISRLTSKQTRAIQRFINSSDIGAGLEAAPASFSDSATSKLVLSGHPGQLKRLAHTFSSSNSLLADIFRKIDSLLDNYLRSDYKINCRGKILDLGKRTQIMGILNVTPDSFSDGGRFVALERALARAHEMVAAGADIIDVGGESTRPGADPISEEEELHRIIPLIERLSRELSIPLSVDTFKSSVAAKALEAGASMVNDISGLRFSPGMAKVVADAGAGMVIMHIKGTPRNMQQNPVYAEVVDEISEYLEEGIDIAIRAGVDREKIIIDPGIGFGKTLAHNIELINRLDEFRRLGRPILLGTSRKKFIGTILDIPVPEQRVYGTAATVALGIAHGAAIVRVHDVASMFQIARMTDAMLRHNDVST